MTKESKLCECGCGDYVKPGNKYINGHNNRNGIALEKTRKKMQEAQIKFFKDPLEREKRSVATIKYYEENSVSDKIRKKQAEAAIKRYEDPLEREKNQLCHKAYLMMNGRGLRLNSHIVQHLMKLVENQIAKNMIEDVSLQDYQKTRI